MPGGPTEKPVIYLDALTAGSEWISGMVLVNVVHELVEHNDEFAELLTAVELFVVPVVNPDGYVASQAGDRFWNKTRNVNEGSDCLGTDFTRNFDLLWGSIGGSTDVS